MKEGIIAKHKSHWMQKSFLYSVIAGIILFAGSLVLNYFANIYATRMASNSVTDTILHILPIINTNFIFVEGFGIFIVFVVLWMIYEPKTMPFVLKSMALFIFIRSVFITLTNIAPLPDRTLVDGNVLVNAFTSGADLFFSAHTGLPFLFALMFWRKFYLRIIFLIFSIVAGISVLLAHLHYSIDVASAFFITHSIYMIAKRMFDKDHKLFSQDSAEGI